MDMSNTAQLQRIKWRAQLMSLPGGVDWLLHCAQLYDFSEKLLGPDHIGLPPGTSAPDVQGRG